MGTKALWLSEFSSGVGNSWTEESGRLQLMGLERARHNWATKPYLLGEGYIQEKTEMKLHFVHSLWVSMLGLQESSHSLHCAQLSPNERYENWRRAHLLGFYDYLSQKIKKIFLSWEIFFFKFYCRADFHECLVKNEWMTWSGAIAERPEMGRKAETAADANANQKWS